MSKNKDVYYDKYVIFFLSLCFGSLAFILSRSSNCEVVIDFISFALTGVFIFILLIKTEWIKKIERANVWIVSSSIILALLSIDIIRQRFFVEEIVVIKKLFGCSDSVSKEVCYALFVFGTIALIVL